MFQTSERRKQFEIGFTQPYFLGRKLTAGFDIFTLIMIIEDIHLIDRHNLVHQ